MKLPQHHQHVDIINIVNNNNSNTVHWLPSYGEITAARTKRAAAPVDRMTTSAPHMNQLTTHKNTVTESTLLHSRFTRQSKTTPTR
ncbi:hypothetical protein M758_3G034700 [Ceratodon purpureus]|nr:hypothetical protein M758_3G034700 [Ceratodon purpureus]